MYEFIINIYKYRKEHTAVLMLAGYACLLSNSLFTGIFTHSLETLIIYIQLYFAKRQQSDNKR